MGIELVDESSFFELEHPSGCVFVMRHWTMAMQDQADKDCYVQDGKGGFTYFVAREREFKIDMCLQDWRGISAGGKDSPCTPENKKRLPVGVAMWLIKEIDERSHIRMTEEEKKN